MWILIKIPSAVPDTDVENAGGIEHDLVSWNFCRKRQIKPSFKTYGRHCMAITASLGGMFNGRELFNQQIQCNTLLQVLWLLLSAGELKHVLTLLPIYQVRMKRFLCERTMSLLSTQFLGGRRGICLIRFLFLPPLFAQSCHKIYSYNIQVVAKGFASKRALTPLKKHLWAWVILWSWQHEVYTTSLIFLWVIVSIYTT